MARTVPISIVYQLDRNNDEPVELLVRATVLPATDCHDRTSVDYPDGALTELDNGEELGEWRGTLTQAEETDLERQVLRAYAAWLKEVA